MPAKKRRTRKPRKTRRSHGKKTISAQALKSARRGGKYPLPLAERKLRGLYSYVKRRGGTLPG